MWNFRTPRKHGIKCPGIALTLIGPGEAKVDLADSDLKLKENLLSTLFIKNTYSCRNLLQVFFLLHTQNQKMTFLYLF